MRTVNILVASLLALVSTSAFGREITLKGSVKDTYSGKPIAGVVVSDGVNCVETNSRGKYTLKSDSKLVRNVFVVTPAEYEVTFNEYGMWDGYYPVDTCLNTAKYNFSLTKRIGDIYRYKVVMAGDPQQMSSRPHSAASIQYTCAALRKYAVTVDDPLYVISLGDMVTNEIEVEGMAQAYLDSISRSNVKWFNVPGNHDHVQSAKNYYDSISEFAKVFGPYNYAVNLGSLHLIFLDSVAWQVDAHYKEMLNDEALAFLAADLAYVPLDTPVMIVTHCPLTKKYGGLYPDPESNDRMVEILQGRDVQFWYGHIHFNSNYSYTDAELAEHAPGVRSIESHTVQRIGGNWACSGEVMRDGSPRGFVELAVNGKDVKWELRSIDPNYPSDFNVYLPGQFAGENLRSVDDAALYCNVYLWDNLWTVPELWVDGAKVADFVRVTSEKYESDYDPLYLHFFPIWAANPVVGFRTVESGSQKDNGHLFKVIPPEGVKTAEIRFSDRFGKDYSRVVSW